MGRVGAADEGGHGQLDRPALTRGRFVFVRAIKGDGRVCPHITARIHMDRGERSTGTSRIIVYRRRLDAGLPSGRVRGPGPDRVPNLNFNLQRERHN